MYQSETGFTPTTLDPSQFGINYDYNKIKDIFDQATAASYKTEADQQQQNENQFNQNQFNTQQSALDTIRKSNAQAIANGASKGMQAANELSAILNLQQQGTTGATTLADNANQMYDKEQQAFAQNAQKALSTANTAGENVFATSVQQQVGQEQYWASIEQALKNLEGTKYAADKSAEASKYAADKNYNGTVYNADKNYAGQTYTADKNYNGTVYNADKNYAGQKYTADQNLAGTKYNADKNYAGTTYSADKNYAGQVAYANATEAAAAENAAATRAAAASSAAATRYAADQSAAATKYAAAASGKSSTGNMYLDDVLKKAVNTGGSVGKAAYVATLVSQGMSQKTAEASWESIANKATSAKSKTKGKPNNSTNSSASKGSYVLPGSYGSKNWDKDAFYKQMGWTK